MSGLRRGVRALGNILHPLVNPVGQAGNRLPCHLILSIVASLMTLNLMTLSQMATVLTVLCLRQTKT